MFKNVSVKKKLLVASVVVELVVLLFGGDLLWSYWQGVRGMVRKELRGATSVQFDLARLDQALNEMTPKEKEAKKKVAGFGVEIDYLEADTVELDGRQTLAKAEMQELRCALAKQSGDSIQIDGRQFKRAVVEEDLARRLRAYEQAEKQLQSRRSTVAKRRETLDKAIVCIKRNEQEKQALADMSDTLNAELRLLEVATATSNFDFKQPNLTKAKTLARDVQKEVETLQRVCDQEHLAYEVPVNLDRRTATERFDAKFASAAK